MGFSDGLDGKESACNAGDLGSIPGSGRSPGEGNGNPLQFSCWRIHGQRSLVGRSPWGHKELDTTEWLTDTWLIHVVWQKPTQHCKAVIPQPKKSRRLGKVPEEDTPEGLKRWALSHPKATQVLCKAQDIVFIRPNPIVIPLFGSWRKNYGLWSLSCTAPPLALHWPTVDQEIQNMWMYMNTHTQTHQPLFKLHIFHTDSASGFSLCKLDKSTGACLRISQRLRCIKCVTVGNILAIVFYLRCIKVIQKQIPLQTVKLIERKQSYRLSFLSKCKDRGIKNLEKNNFRDWGRQPMNKHSRI